MATMRGGEKLTAELQRIADNVRGNATVKVGFLEKATYPDGTPVAMVAAIQEFGAPSINIPPRPFFRNMIADKSSEWPKAVGDLLKSNDFDAEQTMGQAGEGIAGQLRQSVVDTNSPPNAASTIERKGASKPLVDTGHMLASIDYEVKT
ncbi:hypothetical protein IC762_17765 [Bradyrhizobium genosp. L]|uniref:hypothetical protein n=1 Tax=Bradyrhizobium genosp. L TaxID=83637 RepID=UPI0018A27B49|nr:hypothetical protein [Bradyrhizobium genosp. L]QPF81672.1 hypothetical protein IC762_17765 [Bradyrhizobium genosp. L]